MRAATYHRTGPAREVLAVGEVATPEPAAHDVRVRLAFSGVNPVDVKRRAGRRAMAIEVPIIPHFDGSGVIDGVGAQVDPARVGQPVWVFEAQHQRVHGTAATHVCVPSSRAVALPDGVPLACGAALGVPALTAHAAVFGDGSVRGQRILVTGGAGAVGNYAVQFARLGGAHVATTVSGDAKAELARRAGAHLVVNYRTEDVAERLAGEWGPQSVDRIVEVDFGANLGTTLQVARRGAVIAAYGSEADPTPAIPFYAMMYANLVLRLVLVLGIDEARKLEAVRDITTWLAQGALFHSLGPAFALDAIADAHEAVERGAVGKVLVRCA